MATPTCTLVCLFSAAFGAATAATCGSQQPGSDLYGGDSQGLKYSDVFNPSNVEPGECCNFCCNIQQWGVVSTVPTAWAYNSIQTPMFACYCKSGSGITSNACPAGKTCYSGSCPSMTKVNASNVVAVEHSTKQAQGVKAPSSEANGVQLVNPPSGKCLDIFNGDTADGTKVELWTCGGGDNQRWNLENGALVNPASGKCLDIFNGDTADGTKVELWTCGGGDNQKWNAESLTVIAQGIRNRTPTTTTAVPSSATVAVRGKGFIPPTSPVPMLNSSLLRFSNVPDAIDWTTKGATTEIKDQGTCGCCWAFATAEAVESAAFMAGGTLEKLSAGQICRCDTSDSGCKGGNPSSAFDYVRSKGLDSYAHDPYGDQVNDKSTDTCEWDGSVAATITGYKQVAQDEESLAAALATYGPLAICINAEVWPNDEGGSDWSWTGIAPWADKCTNKQADHCVQLVGYDKTASTPYWKLRNQWGNTWGESGYVRLPFGSNPCGITQAAYIVEGAKLSGAQILV